jgi:hypothetical protein
MLCPVWATLSDCPLGMGARESDKAQYPSERPGEEIESAACGLENARLDSDAS